MEQELLRVNHLTIEFKSETAFNKAVDDISFSLNKGEILGIVGESGSGKSVTSLAIMQLLDKDASRISSGEIIFHDKSDLQQDLLQLNEKEMRKWRGNKIAMIFQEPMTSLNPVMKCGKQVMEAILLHQQISKKEAKEKTIFLFNEVLLPKPEEVFNKYPHELSGGQKQRVMIAMAISGNPLLLIADEPTTALDVTVQKTILQLLKNLQQKHRMSVIFITHDLGVVAEIADNVVVLFKGNIVEQGNVNAIFKNARHPYTQGLLACRPRLDKRLAHLPTVNDFINQTGFKEIEISKTLREEQQKIIYAKPPILQIKDINVNFITKTSLLGKPTEIFKAVKNISFDVFEGETLGLVGESGCGKTTLGRSILQLIKASSGQVLYKGKELTTLSNSGMRAFRQKLQIIFQDPYSSLNPRISIGNAIMEPMKVHNILENDKARKARVIEILERVNMNESHFKRYPHEFSGGQRQRICIARALALNPELIICDESVSALDVSVQAQVLNLLNELKLDFKFTYIFISHDLSVVKFMSDRMIVMKCGEIVEMGEADNIYSKPLSPYTKNLIQSIPGNF
ncbi:MAG: ABC transporter ATP-binding protein [Bacteroidetes bacterium]|nr:ABC transporter ATP-binding protein [Bacteroidota bacterium]